jgi:protein phosphatase
MELNTLHKNDTDIFVGFAESRIGGRAENQDSYGYKETPLGFLLTVCDGMGGGPGGKTASSIAVEEIITGIDEANDDEEISNIIIKAIRRANMAVIEAANENPSLAGMGSTATVLLLSEQSAFIAHVGDSRIYQIRGGRKIFRTYDHSMVFELVKQKVITEEQARLSAQSNIITRALGMKPDLEVDIVERPYVKGDRFVLCSDGIHGSMPEKELLKMLGNRKISLGALVDDISTCVDNLGRTNGGHHDNMTLAIVETKNNSKLKEKMSKRAITIILALALLCMAGVIFYIVRGCN